MPADKNQLLESRKRRFDEIHDDSEDGDSVDEYYVDGYITPVSTPPRSPPPLKKTKYSRNRNGNTEIERDLFTSLYCTESMPGIDVVVSDHSSDAETDDPNDFDSWYCEHSGDEENDETSYFDSRFCGPQSMHLNNRSMYCSVTDEDTDYESESDEYGRDRHSTLACACMIKEPIDFTANNPGNQRSTKESPKPIVNQ